MKFSSSRLKRIQSEEEEEEKTVLFVCVENSARSQMAEGFFRKYAPRGYSTISAGTKPSGEINPLAIQVMKELGVDISKQKSKIITEEMIRNSTVRVNMGCMERESCPTLFIHNVLEWGIEDPKGKSIEKVREIRDNIEQRVRQLATDLIKGSQQIKF
jgi:arsenate reductase (thioredoxin)